MIEASDSPIEGMGPVVLKVGGSVLTEGLSADLAEAVARLHRTGHPVVLVHGGGGHVTEVLARLGLATEFVDGLRVTSPEVMEVVEMVLAGRVNKSLVSALQRRDVEAVGISGKDGGTLQASPHPSSDRLGLVGTVRSSDTRLVRRLLDDGFLPVVCSVAGGDDATTYNVNADEAASALAASLGAARLVLLTDVPGVRDGEGGTGEVVARLTRVQTERLLEDGAAVGGMRPKLRACLDALAAGVGSAQVMGVGDATRLPDVVAGTATCGTTVLGDDGGPEAPPKGPAPTPPGAEEYARRGRDVLLGTYRPLEIAFRSGKGTRLRDVDGKEYLDFIAGIAVSNLGHAHPALTKAIATQASRYLHVSNLYVIPEQVEAAELLVEGSGMDRAFFCNSGAEAVEGVIKVARKWGGAHRGRECHEVVVMEGAFHGRTLGALSATWNPRYREPFAPLVPGFHRVPYDDLEAVEKAIDDRTCAVLVEAVQGEAGVIPASEPYLRGLRELTRDRDVLLCLDEVQTGVGRTGRMFAYQHYGVEPDLVATAKGLGGGVPVGAVLATEGVAGCMEPGDHATTFGGNALATAAVGAVLRHLLRDGGLERGAAAGAYLRSRLEDLATSNPSATGVRGLGLLLALEVRDGAGDLARALAERGLLVNALGDQALRLAPPLTITDAEIDEAVEILDAALRDSSTWKGASPSKESSARTGRS